MRITSFTSKQSTAIEKLNLTLERSRLSAEIVLHDFSLILAIDYEHSCSIAKCLPLEQHNIGYEEREKLAHDLATSRFVTVRRERSIDNRQRREIGPRGKHRCCTSRRFTFLLISRRRGRGEDSTRHEQRADASTFCTGGESPRMLNAERKSPYRKITKSFGFHAEVSTSNNSSGSLAPARFSRTCTPPFKSIGTLARSRPTNQQLENSA